MRLLAVPLLSLLASLSPATANGALTPLHVRAQIQSHGIQLSLAMPRGPFAWNSFIPVTARVVNVSGHVVKIGPTDEGVSCFVIGPVVEVERRDGETVFPPSVPNPQPLPCPYPHPGTGKLVQPGAEMTVHEYIILRAAHLRTTVTLVEGEQNVAISTPALTVTLHLVPAPVVRLHTNGSIFATLTRPAGAQGPMLAAWW